MSRKFCLIFIFFVLSCILLASCSTSQSVHQGASSSPGAKELSLYLTADTADKLEFALDSFCAEVFDKTNGVVAVVPVINANPISSMRENGGLAFAENSSAIILSPYFRLFSEPFLFKSYDHFTMSVNSAEILDELNASMTNVLALAAFYQGSDFIISRMPIDDPAVFIGEIMPESGLPNPKTAPAILMCDSNVTRFNAYASLGAVPIENADINLRIDEIKVELTAAEFSISEADALLAADIDSEDEMQITQTFHNASPLWLLAGTDLSDSLSIFEQAVITDAIAGMFAKIDGEILAKEADLLENLYQRSILPGPDFYKTRRKAREYIDSGIARGTIEKRILAYIYDI